MLQDFAVNVQNVSGQYLPLIYEQGTHSAVKYELRFFLSEWKE